MQQDIINTLYEILKNRKNADPKESYVASLYVKGTAKICDKVIEEAHETIAEALKNDPEKLKQESADLLFHLMVLWADQGITPEDVLRVLQDRLGVSGHSEKAARQKS